jgi:hypothetical protein
MSTQIDEFGVNSEDLRPNELAGYMALVDAVRNSTLTVEKLRGSITLLKDAVEQELSEIQETPQTWITLVALFVPFAGMMRKWYMDQRKVYLLARLKNLILISNIFLQSERVQKDLERQIANLKKAQEAERR